MRRWLAVILCLVSSFAILQAVYAESMILDEGTYTELEGLKVRRMILRKKTPVTITPDAVTLAPGQSFTFAIGGGNTSKIYTSDAGRPSPGGQRFELVENNSGGTLDGAVGIYKAGPKGGVIDIVALFDEKNRRTLATITVSAIVVADTVPAIASLTTVSDPANWPGAVTLPSGPVELLPFAPKSKLISNTRTPSFFWSPLTGASSYKIFLSRQPLSSQNTLAAATVTDPRYAFNLADATIPLADGQSYDWTVIPKDSAGKSMITIAPGFFGSFTVAIPKVDTSSVVTGDFALSKFTVNDISIASLGTEAWWNREYAANGTMEWKGVLLPSSAVQSEKIAAAYIMVNASDTYVALKRDASSGAFSHLLTLKTDADFIAKIRLTTSAGRTIDIVPDLKVLHYRHKTQAEEVRELLDKLALVHLNNDRRALLELIDRDYISTATNFRDYQELDNSMRDLFNRTSTSFCRWSSEDITIISPQRQLTIKFGWRQTINYTTLNSTRTYSTDVRLDLRRVNGKWLIREDLDRALFVNDFGSIPAPPE